MNLRSNEFKQFQREMESRGYVRPTLAEVAIYRIKGENFLNTVLDAAFRYSMLEIDELDIRDKPSYVRIIHMANRHLLTFQLASAILQNNTTIFIPNSEHNMLMHIKQKYACPLEDKLRRDIYDDS